MSFNNKVVIVTGSSAGIGANIAILFSKENANVVLVGRNETALFDVAQQCDGESLIIKADVTIEDDVKRIIQETIDTFGKLDILVNNAGIVKYESILDENVLETFDELINTNLRAVVNVTRLAVPHLIKTKGNIVNISTVSSKSTMSAKLVAYSVSKAGLDVFTKGMALELAEHGVRVNSVSPGPVRTDIRKNCGDDTPWDFFNDILPLGKVGEVEDIGHMVLYLAGEKAGSITGVDYWVDNGLMLRK